MEWSVRSFLLLNATVVFGLVVYLLRRPPRAKARLRLVSSSLASPVRQLNIFFNYNGHTWEAYEVLGLPSGTNFQTAQEHFEVLAIKADPQSLPFLVAAIEAIRETKVPVSSHQ